MNVEATDREIISIWWMFKCLDPDPASLCGAVYSHHAVPKELHGFDIIVTKVMKAGAGHFNTLIKC